MTNPQPRSWQVEDPHTGSHITIAGRDWGGNGPVALLSHANGFCAAMWHLVAEPLSEHYRVIAVDARGHGDSDSPPAPEGYNWDYFVADLTGVARQLLDECGQGAIAYGIGNSFGGIVTAAAASRAPGLFQRVAMLDPPIHPGAQLLEQLGVEPSPRMPSVIAAQARKRSSVFPSRDFVREAWRGKPLFASWDPRALELYVAEGFRDRDDGQIELKCNPEVEATVFDTTGSLDVYACAPDANLPVMLVRAADGFIEPAAFEHLAGLFPDCQLVVAPAGHLLPMEAPDLTLKLLLDYAGACRT